MSQSISKKLQPMQKDNCSGAEGFWEGLAGLVLMA